MTTAEFIALLESLDHYAVYTTSVASFAVRVHFLGALTPMQLNEYRDFIGERIPVSVWLEVSSSIVLLVPAQRSVFISTYRIPETRSRYA